MEPATGASTWAFGSHKCTPYSGIFTKKAIRQAIHQILSPTSSKQFILEKCKIANDNVPAEFCNDRRAISRGKDPASV